MADTTTTLAATLQTETVSGDMLMQLADREALPEHPALFYAGSVDAANSATKRVPELNLGGGQLPQAQGSEDNAQTATAFGSSNTDISVVRQTKVYDSTDLLHMVESPSRTGFSKLSEDAVASYAMRLTQLIAIAAATFTTVVGTTNVDFSVAQALTATGGLRIANVSAQGGYMGLLHGYMWRDLIVDAGSSNIGGIQERSPGLAQLSVIRGGSFMGNWLGVDWFVTNYVPAATADFTGGVFGYGGIAWADGRHGGVDMTSDMALLANGRVLFERDRTAASATMEYASHSYLGVTKALEAGIQLLADGA